SDVMCESTADIRRSSRNLETRIRERRYIPRSYTLREVLLLANTRREPRTSDEYSKCLSRAALDVRRLGHQSSRPPVELLHRSARPHRTRPGANAHAGP